MELLMATLTLTLDDGDAGQLAEVAAGRSMTPEALVERWVRERLVHERERAAGGGKDMSPRSRREREDTG
jgi:hypothetical protein